MAPNARPTKSTAGASLDGEGQILALEISAKLDMGARAFFGVETLDRCLLGLTAVYRARALKVEALATRPTLPLIAVWVAWEKILGLMAIETHVQDIIEELGEDPITWKSQEPTQEGQ
jgi:CO/xanthine dehydrogenase Mo-binding subunit